MDSLAPYRATISRSFFGELTESGKKQYKIMKSFVVGRSIQMIYQIKLFYAALMAVCQSSGNGKTKFCYELLGELSGVMTVFRAPGESNAFPEKSGWADEFLNFITATQDDRVIGIDHLLAINCNVGRCLIAIYVLIQEFKRQYNTLAGEGNTDYSSEDILRQVRKKFLDNEVPQHLFIYSNHGDKSVDTIVSMIEDDLEIFAGDNEHCPFVLVFDEAHLLLRRCSKQGTDAFKILRRALHVLPPDANIMCLVVGTNSTIADFHPVLNTESLRTLTSNKLIPPYILCENWDVLHNADELASIKITPEFLLDMRTMTYLISLGRPLWSSLRLSAVIQTAIEKLRVDDDSEAANLVHILMRAALSSAPESRLSKTLVQFYMASLISVGRSNASLKVEFCSEPVLPMASRIMTSSSEKRKKVFETLLQAVQNNTVDRGRILESLMFYICLLAGDDCDLAPGLQASTSNAEPPYLRPIYQAQRYLFGRDQPRSNRRSDFSWVRQYRVFTFGSFIKKLIGLEEDADLPGISANVLNCLMNASHLIPTLNSFPVAEVWGQSLVQEASIPDAWTRSGTARSPTVNFISEPLLKLGLQRQAGFITPPLFYGVDGVLPAMLPNGKIFYFPIQVKMNVDDLLTPICKMAAQCHFLACLKHGNESCRCPKRTPAANVKFIHENQVSLLLCAAPVYEREGNSLRTSLPARSNVVSNWQRQLGVTAEPLKLTKETIATGLTPILVAEREIRAGVRLVTVHWKIRDRKILKHTCIFVSGFNNFPVMSSMQELAYDIIRYYTDPFGEIQQESDGVERSRLYREIGNRVIKRSIGKYPALDETVRIRGGLSPMPDIEDFAPN